jgi:hypothetical protein
MDTLYERGDSMRLRRVVIWIVAPIAALLLIAGGVAFAFFRTFYPSPPEAQFPPATDAKTAQLQDLEYFRHYVELNRTFTPEARARLLQLLEENEARAGSLSPAQFSLAIAEMAALGDNGHSRIGPGRLARLNTHLPCRLYRFADGYYVVRARSACAELLGAKILQIDGRPIEAIADAMFRYFGGPRNHYDQYASPFFLESPELLNAAGLAAAPDRATLRVRLRDGIERDAEIVADPANPDGPRIWGCEFLSPLPVERESADWQPLITDEKSLPGFLRDIHVPFRSEYWQDKGIYYAQFRSNIDQDGFPIGEFLEHLRTDIRARRPRQIVLDLRFNQGGNFTLTASFMKELPTLTDSIEHVYALTSPWTFSAGIVSLALLEEHGGDKVTIVGEPVGDRMRIWAEGGDLDLPNSNLNVSYSTGLHDYTRPCTGEPGCFWVMYFFPTHLKTLEPDVLVPYTFDDYIARRDPALERVIAKTGT